MIVAAFVHGFPCHRITPLTELPRSTLYAFFEKEKQEQRSLLRNQVVKHTAMACGIGTTTVSRLHKDFQGHEGLLPSPEKRYVESWVQIALDEYDVAAIHKEVHQFYE